MPDVEVKELKQQIQASVRRNSDRGFIPYGKCFRITKDLDEVLRMAEECLKDTEYRKAFDIYIMVLVETVRLIAHADDSAGCCGDIIRECLEKIEQICVNVASSKEVYYFETLIKTAKNKVFKDWAEWAYALLKPAVYFVGEQR
jgi:hypothetical protein